MKAFIAAAAAINIDSKSKGASVDGYYSVWESGKDDEGFKVSPSTGYMRVVPTVFTTGTDDIFMRSMLSNYALEIKKCDHDEDDKPIKETCKPTGKFVMNEAGGKAASAEVLATHKGLKGDALKAYMDTYFAKAWGHFDVNRINEIEVQKMPQFMRFLASDQRMSLGENGF